MKRRPTAIVPSAAPAPSALAQRPDLVEAARDYVEASRARNTQATYRYAEDHFMAWCKRHGLSAWPATPETVFTYFTDCAASGAAWNTIAVRRAAIAVKHRHLGFEPPTKHHRVKTLLEGIRRKASPAHGRAPLTWDALPAVLAAVEAWPPLEAARGRAVLLLGVASALRREQIAGLDLADVVRYPRGLVLRIRREKTMKVGDKPRVVRIPKLGGPLCPVEAVEAWLSAAGVTTGPVFRALSRGAHVRAEALAPGSVWAIVKSAVEAAGLDPAEFGAHSLRAGFVTAARARGVDWGTIMQQTGHRRMETVLKYDRPKEDDAAAWDALTGAMKSEEEKT